MLVFSRSMSDEEKGPYQFVFLQECAYMNELIGEMVRSLGELQLGFKGELQMSEQMEELSQVRFFRESEEFEDPDDSDDSEDSEDSETS